MSELDVRIVKLEPIHVASAHGFGGSPEPEAWRKLLQWAERHDLLADQTAVRFFGFNNPDPSPGSPNYGYEQWMTVEPDIEPEGDIRIERFGGGRYAVTRCTGIETISPTWRRLLGWFEDSAYRPAHHQWLEEVITAPHTPPEDIMLDLYLPIAESSDRE